MKRFKKLSRNQQKNAEQLFADLSAQEKVGRQKKNLLLSLKNHLANQVEAQVLSTKSVLVEPIFSLKESSDRMGYFARKAQKRLEKLTIRQEKRAAKEDKIAVRAKEKAAKKAIREAKEAKRAAKLAKA